MYTIYFVAAALVALTVSTYGSYSKLAASRIWRTQEKNLVFAGNFAGPPVGRSDYFAAFGRFAP
jgi:uncharacterized membrane protein YsdA (DUF1294 family)